jgi:hypothetical protein
VREDFPVPYHEIARKKKYGAGAVERGVHGRQVVNPWRVCEQGGYLA